MFGVEVQYAKWDESLLLWEILVEDAKTGRQTKWLSNVLFDNGGGFHRPKYANIPGRDVFEGPQIHTARWREVDLKGKCVALIGTGPSAAQVGPKIQPLVRQLYVFQRSSGHVLPRNNYVFSTWTKLLFQWCYPLLWLYHVWYFWFVSVQTEHFGTSKISANTGMIVRLNQAHVDARDEREPGNARRWYCIP